MPLTIKRIEAIKEPGRYMDGDGLHLVVRASGGKSWILRTMVRGKRTDIGLGGYPLIGLEEARNKAFEARKLARTGGDPLAEKRKVVLTFKEAATKCHAESSAKFTNIRHSKGWLKSLEQHIFPKIGRHPINELTGPDILDALKPIWKTKHATAKKIKQRIGVVFDWAYANGQVTGRNPVDGIEHGLKAATPKVKNHPAMPWQSVPKYYAGDLVAPLRFIILTCVRTNECIGAEWAEVDFANRTWTIPGTRMKMKKEHRVPLTDEAIAVLEGQKGLSERWVFPSPFRGGKTHIGHSYMRRYLIGSGVTVHGFRSSFRDFCSEFLHADDRASEACLAHDTSSRTEKAYARSDLYARRKTIMEAWATHITTKPADNVVPYVARTDAQS